MSNFDKNLRVETTIGSASVLPGLTMGCRYNVILRDQNAAAFVLGEETEPCRFAHQHLPREFTEGGAFAANDATGFDLRSDATLCKIRQLSAK